ncbi:hypothetical protein PIB30_066384 [Stylosanthes scabra]|uniref:Uncharacterized protein n=1 Tax=Stylosanthes scabra TaxID=79078 RepID=A0ABU6ULS2_9FABA|nr:hypothetical protein [Stylosanthes scabra]
MNDAHASGDNGSGNGCSSGGGNGGCSSSDAKASREGLELGDHRAVVVAGGLRVEKAYSEMYTYLAQMQGSRSSTAVMPAPPPPPLPPHSARSRSPPPPLDNGTSPPPARG